MSMWADYQKERLGKHVLETEDGFAVYEYLNESKCYIEEIYVRPESRKAGVAKELADTIAAQAKVRECTHLLGSVSCGANGDTESMKVLLAYGMRLYNIHGNLIMFSKELGE